MKDFDRFSKSKLSILQKQHEKVYKMNHVNNKFNMLFFAVFVLLAVFAPRIHAGLMVYTYDALHRVTQVTYENGAKISYAYDAAGNRTTYVGTPEFVKRSVFGKVLGSDRVTPLASVDVSIAQWIVSDKEWKCVAYSTTTENGTYQIRNLMPGTYRLAFNGGPLNAFEFYDNVSSFDKAKDIVIDGKADITGVDAILDVIPPNTATLRAISLSAGRIIPLFSAAHPSYTLAVANTVRTTTVTPVAWDGRTTVEVNGKRVKSGATSAPIPLNVGSNTITVRTASQDGKNLRSYRVTVTRAPSSVATLDELRIAGLKLNKKFSSSKLNYTVEVDNRKRIRLHTVLSEPNAVILVNGKKIRAGKTGDLIRLRNSGDTVLKIAVISQDKKKNRIYTLTIKRTRPSIAALDILTASGEKLYFRYNPKRAKHEIEVSRDKRSLRFLAWTADPRAAMRVNGKSMSSGIPSMPVMLKSTGRTLVRLVVTAQDGSNRTYWVTVIKPDERR